MFIAVLFVKFEMKNVKYFVVTHFGNGFSYRLCIVVLNIDNNIIVTLLFFLYVLLDFVLIVKKSYNNIILITLNKKIRLVKTMHYFYISNYIITNMNKLNMVSLTNDHKKIS